MPRSTRSLAFGDLAIRHLNPSSYICSSCRHSALRRRIATQQSLRHASSKDLPFTENVRRNGRGLDDSPGSAGRYGGESLLERRSRDQALNDATLHEQNQLGEENVEEMGAEQGRPSRSSRPQPQKAAVNVNYVPATTWDGLRHVGHKGYWRDLPPTPADSFYPFVTPNTVKATTPNDLLSAMHRAMVEVVTLDRAGLNMDLVTLGRHWYPEILDLIAKTTLGVAPNSSDVKLIYPNENARSIILGSYIWGESRAAELIAENSQDSQQTLSPDSSQPVFQRAIERRITTGDLAASSISAGDVAAFELQRRAFSSLHGRDEDALGTEGMALYYQVQNRDFLDLELNFKEKRTLCIISRIAELTGVRIPDPILGKAQTLRSIYLYQLEALKPKPKNLAETLVKKRDVAALPNVKVMGRRETPVDKEKAVGRWKVIEAELRSRGLPVLGTQEA